MSNQPNPDKRGFIIKTISLRDTDETREMLKQARIIAARDGWSFSRLMQEALQEYIKRHGEGNPQFALTQYIEQKLKPLRKRHRFKGTKVWCPVARGWRESWFCKAHCGERESCPDSLHKLEWSLINELIKRG